MFSGKPVDEAKALKDRGNEAYKKKEFSSAIELYTEALKMTKAIEVKMDQPKKQQEVLHSLAVLYSNRAECYLKIHKFQHALDDALMSVSHDGHWFKVTWDNNNQIAVIVITLMELYLNRFITDLQ